MPKIRLYIAPGAALAAARQNLQDIPLAEDLEGEVSHVLLPIPTRELPENLPTGVTVIGGNLPEDLPQKTIDLLHDSVYLARNAAITAHGAVKTAMQALPVCLWECKTLILGWGRIAQCLAHLLKSMGAAVTVAARREDALAMAEALGFDTVPLAGLNWKPYRLVYNTIPAQLPCLEGDFSPGCVKIELSSQLSLPGDDVIWARGLPGKEAPESSGRLIADRVLSLLSK